MAGPTVAPVPPPNPDHARWFTEEVQPHGPQLKAWLRGSFPTVRDVDDVVQESYLRVWKARATRPIASAKSFLFSVARHLAIDTMRRNQTARVEPLRETGGLSVIEDKPDAAAALAYHEKVSLMGEALAQLPDRCRQIFILRKLKQVPQKEIAAQLGISERTVESQITRGMKLCEAWLRQHGVNGFSRDDR